MDDEADLADLTAMLLQSHRLPTQTTFSAREALDFLATGNDIDALVSDIVMPGMTGLELADAIRAIPTSKGRSDLGFYAAGAAHEPGSHLPFCDQAVQDRHVAQVAPDLIRPGGLEQVVINSGRIFLRQDSVVRERVGVQYATILKSLIPVVRQNDQIELDL